MKKLLLIITLFVLGHGLNAQQLATLPADYQSTPILEVMTEVSRDSGKRFFYKADWPVESLLISGTKGDPLLATIQSQLKTAGYDIVEYRGMYILLNQLGFDSFQYETWSIEEFVDAEYMIVGQDNPNDPQPDSKISGFIRDGADGSALVGASITLDGTTQGTVTNYNGYYEFTLPTGRQDLLLSYSGYETTFIPVQILNSGSLDLEMYTATVKLEEVTITAAGAKESVQEKVVGKEVMSIESIKNLPAFFGEVDPVKSLVTLPGVSSVGEGAAGYNVRGGDPGQNLLLQDNAILYSASHLFGFFSAFNSDMIRDVELLKGGGPANYGGRVSSTLNVNLRNGNSKKFQAKGGIGLVSSRLMLEGPIIKDKTSFIIGGRASYSDWLLRALKNPDLYQSSASFYDANFKLNHQHDKNNVFTLSSYISKDRFTFASDTVFSWKTQTVTAGWSHIFSDKLLMQTNLVYSNYESAVDNDQPVNAFDYTSGVRNYSGNIDLSWSPDPANTIDFGVKSVLYDLNLGEFYPGSENQNEQTTLLPGEKGIETAAYINLDHDFSSRFSVNAGVRFTNYSLLDGEFYDFDEEGNPADTLMVGDGANKSFFGVEPRLSFRYLLSPSASLKASYYRTRQYIHLISNTTAVSPVDYWKSSSFNLNPSNANQYTFGFFKNFLDNKYEFSTEVYYKDIDNLIDYKDGATILLNETLENDLLQGDGRAYGVELLLRKNRGKLTGWIGYTYSRTERRFAPDAESGETINNGEYYPSNYDKPHDLTVIMNYKASRRFVLNMNFSYSTGRPITTPISKFQYGDLLSVLNFSERNQFRVPDYHRLDLSVTYKGSLKKEKKIDGEWVFSLYNVYGRKNPYSVYFDQEGNAFQLTILGSVFPSLSYNFTIN